MNNPWTTIDLADYENHMALEQVFQLQALNRMMAEQFLSYPAHSLMILGIAGGNGLEHIKPTQFSVVYGVDVNPTYLKSCRERYPELDEILTTLCVDLSTDLATLPHADLLVADLLIEYIGCDRFREAVERVKPNRVSCIIQLDTNSHFVSDSPYLHVFDCLTPIHRTIDAKALILAMKAIGYNQELSEDQVLPNGKKLLRLDFSLG